MELLEAFGLPGPRSIHLIGGGGKTTLMCALAHALAATGRTVVATTTTKIREPLPGETQCVLLADESGDLAPRLSAALATHRHVTLAASRQAGLGKLLGLPLATLDALLEAGVADCFVVEADGAARRPLKAHLDHEPVVSGRPGLVIAVVGVDVLGQPMDDAHVHRSAVLRQRLGRPPDAIVTPGDIAAALLGPGGYVTRVAATHEFAVLLAKAEDPASRDAAGRIAGAIRDADVRSRITRLVIGDVRSGTFAAAAGGA